MSKKETYNCTQCGRDTNRKCKICKMCLPILRMEINKTETYVSNKEMELKKMNDNIEIMDFLLGELI